jgi:hypothetical protein
MRSPSRALADGRERRAIRREIPVADVDLIAIPYDEAGGESRG